MAVTAMQRIPDAEVTPEEGPDAQKSGGWMGIDGYGGVHNSKSQGPSSRCHVKFRIQLIQRAFYIHHRLSGAQIRSSNDLICSLFTASRNLRGVSESDV